jgi:hypothetical protein
MTIKERLKRLEAKTPPKTWREFITGEFPQAWDKKIQERWNYLCTQAPREEVEAA